MFIIPVRVCKSHEKFDPKELVCHMILGIKYGKYLIEKMNSANAHIMI